MKAEQGDLSQRQSWLIRSFHLALLIVITSIVFSNSVNNDYHLDSVYRVKLNTEINEFWPPSKFFTDLRTGSTIPQIAEYRPIMPLSHAINSEIAKVTGTSKLVGFHVGNILIHIGTSVLVYFLFCFLLSHWGKTVETRTTEVYYSNQAFATALIFAVHPIAGSAVNYIAGRDLLLMVFFFIASMLTYFHMRKSRETLFGWFISLLLLCLAILSKQVAIIGFAMIFLFEWVLLNEKLKDWRLWARTALFSLPTAGYFLLRWILITKQNTEDTLRIPIDIFFPLTMAKAHVFYYMKNLIWPFEMRALAKFDMTNSLFDVGSMIGVSFIIFTFVIAWLCYKRKPLITFSILAYWLLFALTASIFPFRFVVTDYRQYLPSIFLFLLIGLVCFSFKRRIISLSIFAGMVLYFSISSYQINQNWRTEESFWQQSVKYGAVALAHQNYGMTIVGKNPKLAEFHYLEAIRQEPFHIYANINLGLLEIKTGKKEEGLKRLNHMVKLNPNWALARYWLSVGLKNTGRKDEALKAIQRAADLDPRSLRYQYEAARALQGEGEHAKSIQYLYRIVEIQTDYKLAGFLLGFAYQKSDQSELAMNTYYQFLEHNPAHVQSNFNLAFELMNRSDCQSAVPFYTKVLELKPTYLEVHLHLSRCYKTLRNEDLAKKHLEIYNKNK